ncbi:UDP-N-acetylmuramate dehydrogenase [Weissella sp. MSCH1]|uniref:UDP-N-acetylmuramate dehydrogenase n=1 Tax=Weissella sp. MSCH1 TaxID=3383343 RepID=UPI003896E68A
MTIKFRENVNLSKYTNTKTGGWVNNMYYPKDLDQLKSLIADLKDKKIDFEVLGDMTNVAIAGGNLNFDVVNMSEFGISEPTVENGREVVVGAGYKMKNLAYWAHGKRYSGLSWMEGIPGTVGAGIFMNAGFLANQDIQACLIEVTVLNLETMEVEIYKNTDLKFRYRYSALQDMNIVVLEGRFLVKPMSNSIKGMAQYFKQGALLRKYHKRRAKNQPLELPSAGTTFVPPTPWHVGGLMRELNMVGLTIGGAQISTKSPGFIVGVADMTGEDYRNLVLHIQREVEKAYELNLIPEVRLLGFDRD